MSETSTTQDTTPQRGWTRRRFLRVLGIGTGTLAVGAVVGGPTLVREGRLTILDAIINGDPSSANLAGDPPKDPFVWFQIEPDNTTHMYIPKVEMGQGVHTAIAQIGADELEAAWEHVVVHQATGREGHLPATLFTFGSTSVLTNFQPAREVGATMRAMLRAEGAAQLGVALEDVTAEQSRVFIAAQPEQGLTYGEIVANKTGEWVIPEAAPALKSADAFRYIGQSVPRVDLRDKVTGRAVYGYDARMANMAYGAVARPPRYGARLVSAAAGDAADHPGVVAVVLEDGFAGVVAETRTQAQAAVFKLALTWEGGTTINQDELEAIVTAPETGGVLIQRVGDFDRSAQGGRILEATYRTPMGAHAHLEPEAALVDASGDQVIAYVSTQAPGNDQSAIADVLGIAPDKVEVLTTYLGGGFGRKAASSAPIEAARLSRAAGRPVHVGWTREDDMLYGPTRPPTHNRLRAIIDADNAIVGIDSAIASSDVIFSAFPGFVQAILGADFLAAFGSTIHYTFPNRQVRYQHTKVPVPSGFWRGLGSFNNIFALETFMDELAHEVGADPVAFRRQHLPQDDLGERMRVALDRVIAASDWDSEVPAGRGRGVALAFDRGTVVALAAEASAEDGQIRVHHVWAAVDPGLVVNPDGAAAQVEGQIHMAMSAALHEKLTVSNGLIDNANFYNYTLLRVAESPQVTFLPINSGDRPVGGIGEPVVGAVPAVISNAIFAATGQRLRDLPFALA